jgi:hypothetical protein
VVVIFVTVTKLRCTDLCLLSNCTKWRDTILFDGTYDGTFKNETS